MLTKSAGLRDRGEGVYEIVATDGSIGSIMKIGFDDFNLSAGDAMALFLEKYPTRRITAALWDEDSLVLVTELNSPPMPDGPEQPTESVLQSMLEAACDKHAMITRDDSIETGTQLLRALTEAETICVIFGRIRISAQYRNEVVERLIAIQDSHPFLKVGVTKLLEQLELDK